MPSMNESLKEFNLIFHSECRYKVMAKSEDEALAMPVPQTGHTAGISVIKEFRPSSLEFSGGDRERLDEESLHKLWHEYTNKHPEWTMCGWIREICSHFSPPLPSVEEIKKLVKSVRYRIINDAIKKGEDISQVDPDDEIAQAILSRLHSTQTKEN
jgi:hypothetical protein